MPRGGSRKGAGRKTTKLSRTHGNLRKITAEEVLAAHDENELWHEQLTAEQTVVTKCGDVIKFPDLLARRAALMYLTDRRDGKAKQAIVGGEEGDNPIKVMLIGAKNV